MRIADMADHGELVPVEIALALNTSTEELAGALGLRKDVLHHEAAIRSAKVQRRLRDLVDVLKEVEPRFPADAMAYAWYCSDPLAGFNGRTAMQLVQEDRVQQVLDYVDALDAGVFA